MSEKHTAPKKILVADDSLTIQKVIRLALSGDGYEIQTVSDGKEAIEQASLFRPDICIIDVSLPVFDAYQIREQLLNKPDLKNIPVILMSSAFEKVDETRAQSLGFSGHLIKPFDPSHLRSTLLSVANLAPKNDPVVETINAPYVAEMNQFEAKKNPPPAQPIQLEPPSFGSLSGQDFPPLTGDNPGSAFGSGGSGMDDIQQLAKNTFELSGLNQHDWGMIELGKADDAPNYGNPTYSQPNFNQPAFNQTPAQNYTSEVNAMDFNGMNQTPGYASPQNGNLSVSPEELAEMIKTEVNKALEQMHSQLRDRIEHELRAEVHAQIPNMAEKIIKEEIHKLLSDPPV